ncbi:AAA-ATPase At3g28580-like [Lycium barbarum]|uniref:AAA-ATPase At3g28580-like n=1 Tax=Lycium barbarum TaxID=112863 RepID=UPI00293F1C8B|nr:AAA-ATPase At3g28580-like [Lycium barbarum]
MMQDVWTQLGPAIATIMFSWTMYQNYFPHELRGIIRRYTDKIVSYFYPYMHIIFHEYESEEWFERSKAYVEIERYLSKHSCTQAKRLKANTVKDGQSLVLTMDDHEEITDEYKDEKVWWISSQLAANKQTIALWKEDDKRFFKLKFHRKNRELITESYLKYVLEEGKAISVRERQRKLYTNNKGETGGGYRYRGWRMWSGVVFEHPSTFDTLAMDPNKKQEIMDDLETFSKSKDYYAKIGKAWKRGYLLYGPPGTGKSSMIAAMANYLQYDVYDLELTSVKDNTELRKLLIDTTSKSIIVIEDIDCSLDLTGQREKNKKKDEEDKEKDEKDAIKEKMKREEGKEKRSEVTLSGLLNFIDGLWSAIGGERLIVFTTNYVEKLDPALIRRGRMDKHIVLSYCCFESFKVLANNYLDVESHVHFPEIRRLLGETNMTPADIAENLMPKSSKENADTCLERLIKALETAKEEAKLKAEKEEEERAKAEMEKEEKEEKKKELAATEEAKNADGVSEKEKSESNGAKENGDVSKG